MKKEMSAVVDIVCEDGLEWVKVSSNTEKRIIWDLTKAGWVASDLDSDSEGDREDEGDGSGDDGRAEVEGLMRQVKILVKAAKGTRVRYRNPRVRLVLPRIPRVPQAKEVGVVLQRLRKMGVVVQTREDLEEGTFEDVEEQMVPGRWEGLSEVVNVDCTVLLAFVSDISHDTVVSIFPFSLPLLFLWIWSSKG